MPKQKCGSFSNVYYTTTRYLDKPEKSCVWNRAFSAWKISIFAATFQISKDEKENQAKIIEREVKAAVAKVSASYEERLSSARAEHNLKIQQGE